MINIEAGRAAAQDATIRIKSLCDEQYIKASPRVAHYPILPLECHNSQRARGEQIFPWSRLSPMQSALHFQRKHPFPEIHRRPVCRRSIGGRVICFSTRGGDCRRTCNRFARVSSIMVCAYCDICLLSRRYWS